MTTVDEYRVRVTNPGTQPSNTAPVWTDITANGQNGIPAIDAGSYRAGSLLLGGFGSATIQVQVSIDAGITWTPLLVRAVAGAFVSTGITSNGLFWFDIPPAALLRVRSTAYSSGTITGTLYLSSIPSANPLNVSLATVSTAFADGQSNTEQSIVAQNGVAAFSQIIAYLYNGSTLDRSRTPNIFKTVTATASGDTAVWTPTSGKKFRIMAYQIEITANAAQAVAGLIEIILRDATTALGFGMSVYIPGAAGTSITGRVDCGWRQLGNGYLSAVANNVLNVNLSAALSAGELRVNVAGIEE